MSATPIKLSHLFGGMTGGVVFGLVGGLLLGSCVYKAGPNHQAASGTAASMPPGGPASGAGGGGEDGGGAPPGGMDPGSSVMESVFAKVGALKQAIQKNPNDHKALVDLGNLYYDAGKFDQAITYYDRALALQRDDPNTMTDLANSYWMSNNPGKALEILREVRGKFPSHWQSAANLFYLAASQRDLALAKESLETVKQLNPGFDKLPEMEKVIEDLNRGGRT